MLCSSTAQFFHGSQLRSPVELIHGICNEPYLKPNKCFMIAQCISGKKKKESVYSNHPAGSHITQWSICAEVDKLIQRSKHIKDEWGKSNLVALSVRTRWIWKSLIVTHWRPNEVNIYTAFIEFWAKYYICTKLRCYDSRYRYDLQSNYDIRWRMPWNSVIV